MDHGTHAFEPEAGIDNVLRNRRSVSVDDLVVWIQFHFDPHVAHPADAVEREDRRQRTKGDLVGDLAEGPIELIL